MLAGGSSESAQNALKQPRVNTEEEKYGRNDLVTITDGTSTETVKFKKAEDRIARGGWRIVK